jgi:hypothetical protein
MAKQVGREHRVAVGQLRDDLVPLPGVAGDPMNEQHHRARARRPIGHPVTVEDGLPDARLEISRPCRSGHAYACYEAI